MQDHLIPAFDRERLCYHFLNYACHSIHYISLSLKGDRELLVTVLQSEDLTYHVYLSDIAEMITAPTNSIYLTPSHRTHRPSTSTSRSESREKSSQTASSTSLDVQTREPLTWENSLLHSTESGQQSELTHIHSMQFSADSSIFTILSQPPKTNNLIWYCWDTTTTRRSRRRIGKLKRDLEVEVTIETGRMHILTRTTGQNRRSSKMDDGIHSPDTRTIRLIHHPTRHHPATSLPKRGYKSRVVDHASPHAHSPRSPLRRKRRPLHLHRSRKRSCQSTLCPKP